MQGREDGPCGRRARDGITAAKLVAQGVPSHGAERRAGGGGCDVPQPHAAAHGRHSARAAGHLHEVSAAAGGALPRALCRGVRRHYLVIVEPNAGLHGDVCLLLGTSLSLIARRDPASPTWQWTHLAGSVAAPVEELLPAANEDQTVVGGVCVGDALCYMCKTALSPT